MASMHPSRRPIAFSMAVRTMLPVLLALAALPAGVARAQAFPSSGRFSLWASWASRDSAQAGSEDFTELIANLSLRPSREDGTFAWALDTRVATYPSGERDTRVTLYEAWVGVRSASGAWRLRAGQLWLHELGGLGSVAGLHGEYAARSEGPLGRFRAGVFAGAEPERYDADWVDGVTKGGGYVALDGSGGRRHVLGWVLVRHSGLTERSVVSLSNFLPVGRRFFLYQAAEYDLQGPGGEGGSELTYLMLNLRYSPVDQIDLQGTYHRGVSIDARRLTEDILNGRPVDPEALQGLLYESGRLRVTWRPVRRLSVWVGAGQDKDDRGGPSRDRLNLGFSARNLFSTGLDVMVSSWRTEQGEDSFDSLSASIGTTIGRRLYLTLDYLESLAVYRVRQRDGGVVTFRPDSSRFALSANLNLNRTWSLLGTVEHLDQDTFDELRVLTGIVLRF